MNQPNTNQANSNQNQKNSSCGCLFFTALFIMVLIFIFGPVFFNKNKNKNQNNTQTNRATTTETTTEEAKSDNNTSYDFEKDAVTAKTDSGVEYVSNIVIVYFKDSATDADVSSVTTKLNGTVVGQLDALHQYQIKVESRSYEELQALCAEVKQMDNVLNAVIDNVQSQDVEAYYPKDGYTDEWNSEVPYGDNLAAETVCAQDAWGYKDGAAPVKVAVIDAGFDTSHPDLTKLTINPASRNSGAFPRHGTLVAGLIGADFDNGIGIAGIAPNAILEGYSLGAERVSNNQIYEYVIKAVENDNRVINISFGSSDSLENRTCTYDYYNEGWSASLLISNLIDTGKDFLIVQSAGNGAKDHKGVDTVYNGMFCSITRENCYTEKHSYEEIMNHVIIVGAAEVLGMELQLADFSNGGENVTICAPGREVYSLTPGGGYEYVAGTSFSAPICSGAAAFLWGLNTYISSADIKYLIVQSSVIKICADPELSSVSGTYQVLNMGRAAMMMPPPPEDENGTTEETPSLSNKDVFYNFLIEGHNNADQFYNDMPIHYELDGNGNKKSNSGDMWYQYSIEDFDGDGELELLVYKRMYTTGITPETEGNYGMLDLYERKDNGVELYNSSFFSGNLTDPNTIIYNNGVVREYVTLAAPGFSRYYIFNKDILARLGMQPGACVTYEPIDSEGTGMNRIISSDFAVIDQKTVYGEELYKEEQSIRGEEISIKVYSTSIDGIEAGTK